MNKQSIFLILFFILGAILSWLWQRPEANELQVTVQSFDERADYYTIHLEYPQFPGLTKAFNKKIEETLFKQVEGFKESTKENVDARKATARVGEEQTFDLTFASDWSAGQLNNKMVSIVIRTYFYTGGAHGGQNIYTFTYDIENKKEVTLDELFGKTKGYLEKISLFSMNELKDHLKQMGGTEPNIEMLHDGTSPLPENFSRFTLGSGNTIRFYFEQYQVAPYVLGEQEVVMPLSYINTQS